MFSKIPDGILRSDDARMLFTEIGRTLEDDNQENRRTKNIQESDTLPFAKVEKTQDLPEMLPFNRFIRRRRRSSDDGGGTLQIPIGISEREIHGKPKLPNSRSERDNMPQSYVSYILGSNPSSSSSGDRNSTQSKEPVKDTIKKPKDPVKETKEPSKVSVNEPAKIPTKEALKDPAKDPIKEPVREALKETVKEADVDVSDVTDVKNGGGDSKLTTILPAVGVESSSVTSATTIPGNLDYEHKESGGEENEGGLIPFKSAKPETYTSSASAKDPSDSGNNSSDNNGIIPSYIPLLGNKKPEPSNPNYPKDPVKETKEPSKVTVKEPEKIPVKETLKNPAKEPPIKEPVREALKETVKEAEVDVSDVTDVKNSATTIPGSVDHSQNKDSGGEDNEAISIPFLSSGSAKEPSDGGGGGGGNIISAIPIIGGESKPNPSPASSPNPSAASGGDSTPSNFILNPATLISPNANGSPSDSKPNSNPVPFVPSGGPMSMIPGLGGIGGGSPDKPELYLGTFQVVKIPFDMKTIIDGMKGLSTMMQNPILQNMIPGGAGNMFAG